MKSLFVHIDRSPLLAQLIPLSLTVIVLAVLISVLHGSLFILNLLPAATPISLTLRWYDIAIGGTIYLKTSIDFAIFMGRMMAVNPGWRSRVAIEIGTAAGNAIGTIAVIALWVVLKDINILLALMVFLASLVLFELAHASLEHFGSWEAQGGIKRLLYLGLHNFLDIARIRI